MDPLTETLTSQISHYTSLFLFKTASFYAERLHAHNPSQHSLYLLARCYYGDGEIKRALHILSGDAVSGENRYLLAKCAEKCGALNVAEEALTRDTCFKTHGLLTSKPQILKQPNIIPNGAAGLYLLGVVFKKGGGREGAVECFRMAVEMDPLMWCAFERLCEMGVEVDVEGIFGDGVVDDEDDDDEDDEHVEEEEEDDLQVNNTTINTKLNSTTKTNTPSSPRYNTPLSVQNQNPRFTNNYPANSHTSSSSSSSLSTSNSQLPSNTLFNTPNLTPIDNTNANTNISAHSATAAATTTPTPSSSQSTSQSIYNPKTPSIKDRIYKSRLHFASSSSSNTNKTNTNKNTSDDHAKASSSRYAMSMSAEGGVGGGRLSFGGSLGLSNVNFGSTGYGVAEFSNQENNNNHDHDDHSVIVNASGGGGVLSMIGEKEKDGGKSRSERNGGVYHHHNHHHQQQQRPPSQTSSNSNSGLNKLLSLLSTLAHAYQHLQTYNCKSSLQLYQTLPPNHYNTGYVLNYVGKAYFELADYGNAKLTLEKMQQVDPSRLEGLEILSTTLWHLKQEVDLCYLAQRVLEFDRFSAITWCVLGNTFSLQKEHSLALKFFKRSIQIQPDFTYSHTLTGHEYVSNEDFDAAISSYRSALKIDDRHYNAWYGLGAIYYRQEKFEVASYHFQRAIRIHGLNSTLYCHLGMVFHAMKKYDDALNVLEQAFYIEPLNTQARFQRANVYISLERYDEALTELEHVRDHAPRESSVYFLMGKVSKKLGDSEGAMRYFVRAMELEPKEFGGVKGVIERLEEEDEGEGEEGGEAFEI